MSDSSSTNRAPPPSRTAVGCRLAMAVNERHRDFSPIIHRCAPVVTVEYSLGPRRRLQMRFGLWVCFVSLMATFAVAQGSKKPALIAACMDRKAWYMTTETVNLTVTIENRGRSTFYVYRPLEWGWTGL